MSSNMHKILPSLFLSAALVLSSSLGMAPCAYADEEEVEKASEKLDEAVDAYTEAEDKVEEIDERIAENEAKAEELEAEIAENKDASDAAVCSAYRYQKSSYTLIDLIFSSEDVSTLFGTLEYIEKYQESIMEVVDEQTARMDELEEVEAELLDDKTAAAEALEESEEALAAAEEARDYAIAKAEEEAEAEAAAKAEEEAAAKAEAEEEAEEEEADIESDSNSTVASTSPGSSSSTSGIDFSMSRADFVDEWGPRIDAYLSGSPLSGYGDVFAGSAWDYGVDPRWSPAIACIESSKGLYCSYSHNAWGWGSVSWSSWEEAIPAHISGLSRLYGSTLTMDAAMKYNCADYTTWYQKCLSEMDKI